MPFVSSQSFRGFIPFKVSQFARAFQAVFQAALYDVGDAYRSGVLSEIKIDANATFDVDPTLILSVKIKVISLNLSG